MAEQSPQSTPQPLTGTSSVAGESIGFGEQLSLLNGATTEINPDAIPKTRAIIGSMAMNRAQMSELSGAHAVTIDSVGVDDGTGRSAAARRRQAEIDRAAARSQRY